MGSAEQTRVRALWQRLRDTDTEAALRRFAGHDLIRQARRYGVNFAAMAGLRQYARCRAAYLASNRTGHVALARREAALAGHQARYFRSL